MSAPIAQHLTLRFDEDRVFAPHTADQRTLARIVLRHGSHRGLLSFGAADTHLHVLSRSDRRGATELDRLLKIHIKKALHRDASFARTRFRDVLNEWHLLRAFRYAIVQDEHHGCEADPLLEATVLPDLLGLRLIGCFRPEDAPPAVIANVAAYLPRVNRQLLWSLLKNPRLDRPDRELVWSELEQAAAATVGLPALDRHTTAAAAATAAAIQLARPTLQRDVVCDLLACSVRTYWRLRGETVNPALLDAVRLQLQLRTSTALARGDLPSAEQAWARARERR